jgi:hypothetical protein
MVYRGMVRGGLVRKLKQIRQMKGYNIGPFTTKAEAEACVDSGAQLLRWHIQFGTQNWPYDGPWQSYTSNLEAFIAHCRREILPATRGRAQVIINVLDAPGGVDSRRRLNCLKNAVQRAWLVATFNRLATEFKDEPDILGYSLNEPGGDASELKRLMFSLWATVTRVNDQKIFCVTNSFGQPGNFSDIAFIDAPNAWHEVHCYEPMSFTHQGIPGYGYGVAKKYPSLTFGKRRLERKLRDVFRFQRKHPGANIFVGEFGVSTVADDASRLNYIRDCKEIFDSHGYHWAFHSWGAGHWWSPSDDIINLLRYRYFLGVTPPIEG